MILPVVAWAALVAFAACWMASLQRMIRLGRWSPRRPALVAVVMAGALALMGDALADWAATGALRSAFYPAAWCLGMGLFDMATAFVLGRRGVFARPRARPA